MNLCKYCKNLTDNPKFCSKSCAAKYNNTYFPKKVKRIFRCIICDSIIGGRRKYCNTCKDHTNWKNFTLGSFSSYSIYQKHAKIRGYSKTILKKTNVCCACGYNKHTEICHIKPISLFNDNDTLDKINAISNLVELCPNCHWEFDHGLIKFD